MTHCRHTDEFSEAPTAEQIERQIRWEAGAVALGVRRYNAELTKRSLSGRQREFADTSLGQGYIRSIVGCLVPVIVETQETLGST
jgi:hypothetical protein